MPGASLFLLTWVVLIASCVLSLQDTCIKMTCFNVKSYFYIASQRSSCCFCGRYLFSTWSWFPKSINYCFHSFSIMYACICTHKFTMFSLSPSVSNIWSWQMIRTGSEKQIEMKFYWRSLIPKFCTRERKKNTQNNKIALILLWKM